MVRSTTNSNVDIEARTDVNGYFSAKTKVDCRGGSISVEFFHIDYKDAILHFYKPDYNPCKLEPLEVYLEPLP